MIRLRQIKKSFQDKSGINEVLRGIDLDVMEGEFVSIMEPSGAGKSLLLSILGMYDSAWQGSVISSTRPSIGSIPNSEVNSTSATSALFSSSSICSTI